MKTFCLSIILILNSCSVTNNNSIPQQNEIQKLTVYKSFLRGGTTSSISYMFNYPKKIAVVDTTNINTGENRFLDEFSIILSEISPQKHYQQKIAGISLAGEFWQNSQKHYFIVCLPDIVIDITNKKEYKINDSSLIDDLQIWMKSLSASSE